MIWTGGCLCGDIRYEADEAETENWYCHCRMCQKATGSVVSSSAIVPKASLRITQGEPKFFQSYRPLLVHAEMRQIPFQHNASGPFPAYNKCWSAGRDFRGRR